MKKLTSALSRQLLRRARFRRGVFIASTAERSHPGAEIEYEGLTHKAGQLIDEDLFGDEENVIVDFKYSAFGQADVVVRSSCRALSCRTRTRCTSAGIKSGRKFHDPDFKSCTKFIATVAKGTFGYEDRSLEELVHWADIIDGAQFPSAQFAVELKEPAMRLMTVIEATRDRSLLHRIIRLDAAEASCGRSERAGCAVDV